MNPNDGLFGGERAQDALTGLPDIRQARDRLAAGGVPAVWVDIDGLVYLNDLHDLLAGDEVLVRTANFLRLQAAIAGADLYRIRGDEFVLLLPPGGDAAALAASIVAGAMVAIATPLDHPSRDQPWMTLSAVAFTADTQLIDDRKGVCEGLADVLWPAKQAAGRRWSVVTAV